MPPRPPAPKPRILLADDEAELLAVMKARLENEGFEVTAAADGEEALVSIRRSPPDIVVLDLKMPQRDGFAVTKELRADPLFENLPIIILSASGTHTSKIEGLDLGVDDFITKSMDIKELLARIRMILKRSRQGLDANPLTRLPGNRSIESHVDEAVTSGRPLAVLYVDLNQFKAYNDAYGYEAGDQVIRATAQLIVRLAREGGRLDFVGHIGGDDFIVLCDPSRMEELAGRILSEFDALAPGFYGEEDRRRGKIVSTDRQGRIREFPLLSIAVGICHNQNRQLANYAQVAQFGAELKKAAKGKPGSNYVVDRRKD